MTLLHQRQRTSNSSTQKRFDWLRLTILVIVLAVVIIVGIFNIQASLILAIVPIVLALFQWLYPWSPDKERPNISAKPTDQVLTPPATTTVQQGSPSPVERTEQAIAVGPESTATVASLTEPVFHFNEPLLSTDEYFGRKRERATLMSRIRNRSSTSILGPRRIGKTWLIRYVQFTIHTELKEQVSICSIDASMPSSQTITGLMTRIIEEFGIRDADASNGITELEKIVSDLQARNIVPIICIDEFEGFRNKPEFNVDFFRGLRSLTQVGLCLIVASKLPLLEIVGPPGDTSGFFNVFEQLTLKPFSTQDAETFAQVKSQQAGFNAQEKMRLLHYGQEDEKYYPLRLQLAGKLLQEDKYLALQDGPYYYRPDDLSYWQEFEGRLEEKYRGIVR